MNVENYESYIIRKLYLWVINGVLIFRNTDHILRYASSIPGTVH